MAEWSPDLFNLPGYAALHGAPIALHWPGAAFHAFGLGQGRYASPGRGPYGGFDADPALEAAGFDDFVDAAEATLRDAGAGRLDVALPALGLAPHHPARLVALCRRGYRVVRQELNQAIPVAAPNFADQANRGTRRRLSRAAAMGVTARLLAEDEHRAAYDAIAENRAKKARPMSMSWDDVAAMRDAFPDRVHLFGAERRGEMLAGAIAMRANARTLYVHAWGERLGAEALSPVAGLAECAYGFAAARGIALLDLGTSSVGGVTDAGLVAFKRGLGAAASPKLWMARCWT